MINLAPKLMFQIMNDRARSRYSLQHLRAAKSIQRFDFEVLAQSKDCLFWQKRVAVVAKRILNFLKLLLLLIADEKFRRRNTRYFVEQRLPVLQLSDPEFTGAEIGVRKTEDTSVGIDGAEIICTFGFEQVKVGNRARANDLSDVP